MKPQQVQERVAEVRAAARKKDHERAHSLEDALHQDVLAAIAEPSCRLRAVLAAQALETRKVKFRRDCA